MDAKELMKLVADRIEQAANVKAVFGEPVGQGMDTVIPVARVSVRGGGGGGAGEPPEGQVVPRLGKGKGVGVGLNVVTAPVGFLKRTSDGWTFEPIVDRNRMILALAAVLVVGLMSARAGARVLASR